MIAGLLEVLAVGALALVGLAALFALALAQAAANAPWWERTQEELDSLPTAGPEEDPRDRPQDGRT